MTAPEPILRVPDTVDAPSLARQFAASHTLAYSVAARDIVELLVSELVTNAYRHGAPPVHVEIGARGSRLRVEVHDAGDHFDVPVITSDSLPLGRSSGWGLAIVGGLASAWGIAPRTPLLGKQVWFELDTTGPFPALPGVGRLR